MDIGGAQLVATLARLRLIAQSNFHVLLRTKTENEMTYLRIAANGSRNKKKRKRTT